MAKEPTKVLTKVLDVSEHATFGHLRAMILTSCTCAAAKRADRSTINTNEGCTLHASHPHLADVVYEITRVTHNSFGDHFLCFANLLVDACSKGRST